MAVPKRATLPERSGTSYASDPYAWALEQASYLRAGAWSQLDTHHLADEIEDVAGTERHRLTSFFRIILLHLLKWDYQPELRSRSWTVSIRIQRMAADDQIEDCPSLKPQIARLIERAYRRARIEAANETNLDEGTFPADCPYDYDTIMNRPMQWPPAAEAS